MIENLLSVVSDRTKASFYRTAAGAEIDMVLDLPRRASRWTIEIRRTLSAKPGRGVFEDIQLDKSYVVYAGTERYPVSEDVQVIDVLDMADMRLDRR